MKQIEIPYVQDRGRRYRFFEMLPGLLSWSILLLPIVLSLINPTITIFFILAYMLMWFTKSLGFNVRVIQGYKTLRLHQRLPWGQMLQELASGKVDQPEQFIPTWHYDNIKRLQDNTNPIQADELLHVIIIAAYNESREILEPTVKAVLDSDFDMKRVVLVMAYEERGGARAEKPVQELVAEYGDKFKYAIAVKHPEGIPGEVIGKGGNITYAARHLETWLASQGIKPLDVIVTTLDSDNRPHPEYLNALTYLYAMCPNPVNISFQPITVYTNNIWDVPAPMRVIAAGSSFWNIIVSMRPHLIRNFSAHAQSMQTLIDTDYWSVRTIVEDGHQFWRTYFRYDGRHDAYPLYLPIYQDAVLSNTYRKTLKAQFVQLRRWAWGASDVAYVAEMGFFRHNRVPKLDLTFKFLRLLEGHISWATAPLILAFAALIPSQINPDNFAANQLPLIASRIQTIALVGILTTLFLSLKMLPPKPARYKKHRTLFMVAQWALLPFTTIAYHAFSALYSQTRLIFGRYLDTFDVTDKAVVTDDKQKIL